VAGIRYGSSTTGRSGGAKNPSGSGKQTPLKRPTSMKRASNFGMGRKEKHSVTKGMKSIKHAKIGPSKGRITSWGNTKRISTLVWGMKVKK
jgi:hypothetical protein